MGEPDVDREIGNRVRRAREEAGLSQQDLAERLGYASPATVSYIESGDRRITVADLRRIAGELGLSLDYFFRDTVAESAERYFSLRADDFHQIAPSSRRAVIDFLLFVQKHGQQCSPIPGEIRRKRPAGAADSLLRRARIAEAPVSPHEVARSLAVPVFDWSFANEISGIFVCHEGKTAIGVNESHPPVRQRFTVAHELGHCVYGRRDAIIFDYLGRERGFSFKTSESIDSETKANQFAADLLMPARWLRSDVAEVGIDVTLLAKRYGASEQAMWFRLVNLKLASAETTES